MSKLRREVDALRRRLPATTPCPEHLPPAAVADLGDMLRAFSPVAEDRAAYLAEQERIAATPPCARCGWVPFVVIVQPTEIWGQHEQPIP